MLQNRAPIAGYQHPWSSLSNYVTREINNRIFRFSCNSTGLTYRQNTQLFTCYALKIIEISSRKRQKVDIFQSNLRRTEDEERTLQIIWHSSQSGIKFSKRKATHYPENETKLLSLTEDKSRESASSLHVQGDGTHMFQLPTTVPA